MVSYKDIQRETGLALSTISKYFNGRTVLEPNRAAIEAAVADLNFRPNGFARSLRLKRSGTIGVLLPHLNNEFHIEIINGVEAALRQEGMSVLLASSPSPEDEAVDLLLSQMVDGIIAIPSPHDFAPLREAVQRIPVVLMDWEASELHVDGVYLDNELAGRMAARHILDHGHREIAVVGGDTTVPSLRSRAQGFTDELGRAGVPLPDEWLTAEELTVEGGHRAMTRVLNGRTRPTAVFCANYHLTLGALIALNESGLRLGEDVSVLGFDSLELAKVTVPRMTVIAQPTQELAAEAAALLIGRLQEPDREGVTVRHLAPALIPGGSVARIHRRSIDSAGRR